MDTRERNAKIAGAFAVFHEKMNKLGRMRRQILERFSQRLAHKRMLEEKRKLDDK